MYGTSYFNMQHLGAGHIVFVLTQVFATFQQSCTLEASLQIFWNNIGPLSKTLYRAQLTEDITKYKYSPFVSFNFFIKNSHVTYIKYVFCHFVVYLFKDISCYIDNYIENKLFFAVKNKDELNN